MNEIERQAIADFARDTLSCQCEEAVFRSITLEPGRLVDDSTPFVRVVIGQRLLIYLVRTVPGPSWPRLLPGLATAGRQERDDRGYNRFRLVLAGADVPEADKLFRAAVGADAKVHLHVVPEQALPNPVRHLLVRS